MKVGAALVGEAKVGASTFKPFLELAVFLVAAAAAVGDRLADECPGVVVLVAEGGGDAGPLCDRPDAEAAAFAAELGDGGGFEDIVEEVGRRTVRGAFGQCLPFSELGSVSKYRRPFGRWAKLCGHDYRDGIAPHTDW